MNLFVTRLIFYLFSEDVGVFPESQFSHALFSHSGKKGEHAQDTRVHAFASMDLTKGKRTSLPDWTTPFESVGLLALVRCFINVRELDIDPIDSVNAFRERFEVASKSLNSDLLAHVQSALVAQRVHMTMDEARTIWPRIKRFRAQEGREQNVHAADALKKQMADRSDANRLCVSRHQQVISQCLAFCPRTKTGCHVDVAGMAQIDEITAPGPRQMRCAAEAHPRVIAARNHLCRNVHPQLRDRAELADTVVPFGLCRSDEERATNPQVWPCRQQPRDQDRAKRMADEDAVGVLTCPPEVPSV